VSISCVADEEGTNEMRQVRLTHGKVNDFLGRKSSAETASAVRIFNVDQGFSLLLLLPNTYRYLHFTLFLSHRAGRERTFRTRRKPPTSLLRGHHGNVYSPHSIA
jgi:hypothetical protein